MLQMFVFPHIYYYYNGQNVPQVKKTFLHEKRERKCIGGTFGGWDFVRVGEIGIHFPTTGGRAVNPATGRGVDGS